MIIAYIVVILVEDENHKHGYSEEEGLLNIMQKRIGISRKSYNLIIFF